MVSEEAVSEEEEWWEEMMSEVPVPVYNNYCVSAVLWSKARSAAVSLIEWLG